MMEFFRGFIFDSNDIAWVMFGQVCNKGLNKLYPHLDLGVFTSKVKSYVLSLYSFMCMLYNQPLIIIQNISFGRFLIVERPS